MVVHGLISAFCHQKGSRTATTKNLALKSMQPGDGFRAVTIVGRQVFVENLKVKVILTF